MFGTFSWLHLSSAPDRLSCGGRECLEGGEGREEERGEGRGEGKKQREREEWEEGKGRKGRGMERKAVSSGYRIVH